MLYKVLKITQGNILLPFILYSDLFYEQNIVSTLT